MNSPEHSGARHGTGWEPSEVAIAASEQADWKVLFETRVAVLPELEKARQNKAIGKSLDAKVELLAYTADALNVQKRYANELRELLNVSQLEVVPMPRAEGTSAWVPVVKKADGQKCERCWHWEMDIGQNTEHPTICGRCIEAVKQLKA